MRVCTFVLDNRLFAVRQKCYVLSKKLDFILPSLELSSAARKWGTKNSEPQLGF